MFSYFTHPSQNVGTRSLPTSSTVAPSKPKIVPFVRPLTRRQQQQVERPWTEQQAFRQNQYSREKGRYQTPPRPNTTELQRLEEVSQSRASSQLYNNVPPPPPPPRDNSLLYAQQDRRAQTSVSSSRGTYRLPERFNNPKAYYEIAGGLYPGSEYISAAQSFWESPVIQGAFNKLWDPTLADRLYEESLTKYPVRVEASSKSSTSQTLPESTIYESRPSSSKSSPGSATVNPSSFRVPLTGYRYYNPQTRRAFQRIVRLPISRKSSSSYRSKRRTNKRPVVNQIILNKFQKLPIIH